jgi:phosphoglucosamine mutase
VDCAHGAAYHIAPSVFRELGAEVIEMGVQPNGLNINLDCGAAHPTILCQRVLAEKADLGVALDGDGDRVVLVDHEGSILDGDDLLYIIVKNKKMRGLMKGGLVGTVMSNLGFEQALQQLDLEFIRVPVGDRYIITELAKRHWCWGGEPSGHIVCLETTTTGDGIIAALQVLGAMCQQNQALAAIRCGMMKYPQMLLNVQVSQTDIAVDHPLIQQAVKEIEYELGHKGRVLLRRSGTEPLIRVMVEGEDRDHVQRLAEQLAGVVRLACPLLD